MLRNLKKRLTSPSKLRGGAREAQQQQQQAPPPPVQAPARRLQSAACASPAAATRVAEATLSDAAGSSACAAPYVVEQPAAARAEQEDEAAGASPPPPALRRPGPQASCDAAEQRDAADEGQHSGRCTLPDSGSELSALSLLGTTHEVSGTNTSEHAGAATSDDTLLHDSHRAHRAPCTSLGARLLALQRCHTSTLGLAAGVRVAAAALEALEPAARLLSRIESQCGHPTPT
jgi:hypothetical protein